MLIVFDMLSSMKPTTAALRAITGVYFQRVLMMVMGLAVGMMALAYLLLSYLATALSPWWWIFLVVMVPLTLLVTAISAVLWFASSKLLPRPMDRTEKKFVYRFGQKLVAVVGQERVPYPIMLVFVVRGVLRGKGSELFRRALDDAPTLRQDFRRITRMFS